MFKQCLCKTFFRAAVDGISEPPSFIRHRMGKLREESYIHPQAMAYRDMASEALSCVAIYNARAQWFAATRNEPLANEYRKLSQDALERAQRYKELADLANKHLKPTRFETREET